MSFIQEPPFFGKSYSLLFYFLFLIFCLSHRSVYVMTLTPERCGHVRHLGLIQVVLVGLHGVPLCRGSCAVNSERPQAHLVSGAALQPHQRVEPPVTCCGDCVATAVTSVSLPVPQLVPCDDAVAAFMWRSFPSHCHALQITTLIRTTSFCTNNKRTPLATDFF